MSAVSQLVLAMAVFCKLASLLECAKRCELQIVKHTAVPFLDFRSRASLDLETLSSEEASSSESLVSPAQAVSCLLSFDAMWQSPSHTKQHSRMRLWQTMMTAALILSSTQQHKPKHPLL